MSANGRLVGYQELADRMGSPVLTLADTPPTPQPHNNPHLRLRRMTGDSSWSL